MRTRKLVITLTATLCCIWSLTLAQTELHYFTERQVTPDTVNRQRSLSNLNSGKMDSYSVNSGGDVSLSPKLENITLKKVIPILKDKPTRIPPGVYRLTLTLEGTHYASDTIVHQFLIDNHTEKIHFMVGSVLQTKYVKDIPQEGRVKVENNVRICRFIRWPENFVLESAQRIKLATDSVNVFATNKTGLCLYGAGEGLDVYAYVTKKGTEPVFDFPYGDWLARDLPCLKESERIRLPVSFMDPLTKGEMIATVLSQLQGWNTEKSRNTFYHLATQKSKGGFASFGMQTEYEDGVRWTISDLQFYRKELRVSVE